MKQVLKEEEVPLLPSPNLQFTTLLPVFSCHSSLCLLSATFAFTPLSSSILTLLVSSLSTPFGTQLCSFQIVRVCIFFFFLTRWKEYWHNFFKRKAFFFFFTFMWLSIKCFLLGHCPFKMKLRFSNSDILVKLCTLWTINMTFRGIRW